MWHPLAFMLRTWMNLSRFKNDSSKIGFKDELEGEGGRRLRRVQPPQRVGDADVLDDTGT